MRLVGDRDARMRKGVVRRAAIGMRVSGEDWAVSRKDLSFSILSAARLSIPFRECRTRFIREDVGDTHDIP